MALHHVSNYVSRQHLFNMEGILCVYIVFLWSL